MESIIVEVTFLKRQALTLAPYRPRGRTKLSRTGWLKQDLYREEHCPKSCGRAADVCIVNPLFRVKDHAI